VSFCKPVNTDTNWQSKIIWAGLSVDRIHFKSVVVKRSEMDMRVANTCFWFQFTQQFPLLRIFIIGNFGTCFYYGGFQFGKVQVDYLI
jgi:hypothetical protein